MQFQCPPIALRINGKLLILVNVSFFTLVPTKLQSLISFSYIQTPCDSRVINSVASEVRQRFRRPDGNLSKSHQLWSIATGTWNMSSNERTINFLALPEIWELKWSELRNLMIAKTEESMQNYTVTYVGRKFFLSGVLPLLQELISPPLMVWTSMSQGSFHLRFIFH